METSAIARRLAARFVAGDTLADALEAGCRINREGISLTLDHLGENVTSLAEAEASRDVYLRALDELSGHGINGNVSLKLSQFGIDISEQACRANVGQVVRRAKELGNFARVDMESSEYTERTLQLVTDLHAQYASVGTVIQAYLYRSEKDVADLLACGCRIRLCKGAYKEPEDVAFPRKADVDANYVRLMKILLSSGFYHAIATHDPQLIAATIGHAAEKGNSKDDFEFQMLYGVRTDLQRRLVKDGYRVRIYIPFGNDWFPYFMRRLAERPANVGFILRNFLRS